MKLFVVMFVLLKLVSAQSNGDVQAFLAQNTDNIRSTVVSIRDSFKGDIQYASNYFVGINVKSFLSTFNDILAGIDQIASNATINVNIDAAFKLLNTTLISSIQQANAVVEQSSCPSQLIASLITFESIGQKTLNSTVQTLINQFVADVTSQRQKLEQAFSSIQGLLDTCNGKLGAAISACFSSIIQMENSSINSYLSLIQKTIAYLMVNYFAVLTQSLNGIAQTLPTGFKTVLSAPCK